MDVQKAKLEDMREEFLTLVKNLPRPMRENIEDSLKRGESFSYMFFMAGYILANKKKEENDATGNEYRKFHEGRSAI